MSPVPRRGANVGSPSLTTPIFDQESLKIDTRESAGVDGGGGDQGQVSKSCQGDVCYML